MLKRVIIKSTMNIQDMNKRPTADRVSFDLNRNAICFDFIYWLATHEMIRRRENAPAPLKVLLTADAMGITQGAEMRQLFTQNVVRPALTLFGAIEAAGLDETRADDPIGVKEIAQGHANGEGVPQIMVPQAAMTAIDLEYLKNKKPVTITLRECGYNEHRNSNIMEWYKLAKWLEANGEHVIIVRDTAMAHQSLDGLITCPHASLDLHSRAALYSQAKANLFVQNGPFALAMFMPAPWLLFAAVDEREVATGKDAWRMYMGCEIGGQVPWATDEQRIVYVPDTFENMAAAYEELRLTYIKNRY
jgi:hypothetical protein